MHCETKYGRNTYDESCIFANLEKSIFCYLLIPCYGVHCDFYMVNLYPQLFLGVRMSSLC